MLPRMATIATTIMSSIRENPLVFEFFMVRS